MGLVFEGERTPGVDLVERMLIAGERFEDDVPVEHAASAFEALETLELAYFVDEMVQAGEMLAEQVHNRVTRGLQEVVQNAQDQGASSIRFGWRKRGRRSELLIRHNGDPVRLHDVVAMAYPLLSGSRRDAGKIGRFGIGLKTRVPQLVVTRVARNRPWVLAFGDFVQLVRVCPRPRHARRGCGTGLRGGSGGL